MRNALRMRPDRIIVGEVRGGETLDMLQAMNTGHEGSLSTAHANSTRHLLWRLETMAMMSDVDLPAAHIRTQVCSAVDVIVHLARMRGGRRVVWEIAAVEGTHRGEPVVTPLFRFRPREGADGVLRSDGSRAARWSAHSPTGASRWRTGPVRRRAPTGDRGSSMLLAAGIAAGAAEAVPAGDRSSFAASRPDGFRVPRSRGIRRSPAPDWPWWPIAGGDRRWGPSGAVIAAVVGAGRRQGGHGHDAQAT